MKKRLSQKGFAALYMTLLVLAITLGIGLSFALLAAGELQRGANEVRSVQAYYAAESGLEDVLLRMGTGMDYCSPQPCTYTLNVGNASSDVTIGAISAGARTIASKVDQDARFRSAEAVYEISNSAPGFFYGAQVGDGGLRLENSSKVVGNVFSNGNVLATGTTEITDSLKVAGIGNKIAGATIGGDAFADICEDSDVAGVLHVNSASGCSYGSVTNAGLPINPEPLPVSDSEITEWKTEAEAGGVISGNYNKSSGIYYLGPQKITGNLTIENTSTLVLTGTVWVMGDVSVKNSGKIKLDSSYGSLSGLMIADGELALENSSISSGSGEAGSYLMYISTSSADPAISIKNSAQADILYTSAGWIEIENNTALREVTGFGIHLKNTAVITYEIGLEDAAFISGPSGGWDVTSWKEVE